MTTLSENPSKAEELAHLRGFIAALPVCSYLRSFLEGADEFAREAMANDVSTELLPQMKRYRNEIQEDANRAAGEVKTRRAELETMRKERAEILYQAARARDYARDAAKALATCQRDFEKVSLAARDMVIEADINSK